MTSLPCMVALRRLWGRSVHPLRRLSRGADPLRRLAGRGEDGFTLIEGVVSLVIMLIVLTMTFVMQTVVTKTSVVGTEKSVSATATQQALLTIEPYLGSAVSGNAAQVEYTAAGISGGSLCPSGPAFTQSTDFSVTLCTQRPASVGCTSATAKTVFTSCPQLYQLKIAPSTCTSSACTFQALDLSVTGSPVVYQLTSVRCDASCQSDATSGSNSGLDMPPLFTYLDASGKPTTSTAKVASVTIDLSVLAHGQHQQQWTEIRRQVTPPAAQEPSV